LTYVLYYEGKKEELEIHYKDEDINVLDYLILRDSNNKAYLSCEYIFDLVAIFPPNLDYIYIKPKGVKILVKYEEFKKELSRFLTNVAGCPDTYKMIEPLKLNKVWKVLKKVKWHEEIDNYNIVYYKDLID
ncbi:MAG: hypothetical protein LBV51_01980, partial [Acholeplasmatales bacterium]|nr:hypothetical protein [Acholeplasmatales bacterium]